MTPFPLPVFGIGIAAADPGQALSTIYIWLAVLVLFVLIGAVAIYLSRRMLKDPPTESRAPGFSLQSLRDMHAAGELSDEEFERAREAMIGRLRALAPPAKPPPAADGSENRPPAE